MTASSPAQLPRPLQQSGLGQKEPSRFGIVSIAIMYMVGLLVIGAAGLDYILGISLTATIGWAEATLGWSVVGLFLGLTFLSVLAIVRVSSGQDPHEFWLEAGLSAAGGIATVALTFTLLGISLGIGSLATETITPETVQGIIKNLTEAFSLAFLSTVIGLPLSAVLRAVLLCARAMADARQELPVQTL